MVSIILSVTFCTKARAADVSLEAAFFKQYELASKKGTIKVPKPDPNKSYWVYWHANGDPGVYFTMTGDGKKVASAAFDQGKTQDGGYCLLEFNAATSYKIELLGSAGGGVRGRGPWNLQAWAQLEVHPKDWKPGGGP
jgi:hypothetical protein